MSTYWVRLYYHFFPFLFIHLFSSPHYVYQDVAINIVALWCPARRGALQGMMLAARAEAPTFAPRPKPTTEWHAMMTEKEFA